MATIKTIVDYFLEGGHGKSCDFLLDRDATVVQVSKPV